MKEVKARYDIIGSPSAEWNVRLGPSMHDYSQIEKAYQTSYRLLQQSRSAGCDVDDEMDLVVRNYGLYLANQDRFSEARDILEQVAARQRGTDDDEDDADSSDDSSEQLVNDCFSLWSFCTKMLQE